MQNNMKKCVPTHTPACERNAAQWLPLLRKFFFLFFWILIWQFTAVWIHKKIFLVGPADTLSAFCRLAVTASFWEAIAFSFGRIFTGFFLAFLLGMTSGALAFRFPAVSEFLEAPVQLMKTIPVASFVILALIWTGSRNLSVFISFLVVYPMIYINTRAGLTSTDPALLEMAKVFRIPLARRFFYLYRSSLYPYLKSACKNALSLGFKSGIAAEVIGVPDGSIGEGLYLSKIYLDTGNLFAWTAAILLVSAGFEMIFLAILRVLAGKGANYEGN